MLLLKPLSRSRSVASADDQAFTFIVLAGRCLPVCLSVSLSVLLSSSPVSRFISCVSCHHALCRISSRLAQHFLKCMVGISREKQQSADFTRVHKWCYKFDKCPRNRCAKHNKVTDARVSRQYRHEPPPTHRDTHADTDTKGVKRARRGRVERTFVHDEQTHTHATHTTPLPISQYSTPHTITQNIQNTHTHHHTTDRHQPPPDNGDRQTS